MADGWRYCQSVPAIYRPHKPQSSWMLLPHVGSFISPPLFDTWALLFEQVDFNPLQPRLSYSFSHFHSNLYWKLFMHQSNLRYDVFIPDTFDWFYFKILGEFWRRLLALSSFYGDRWIRLFTYFLNLGNSGYAHFLQTIDSQQFLYPPFVCVTEINKDTNIPREKVLWQSSFQIFQNQRQNKSFQKEDFLPFRQFLWISSRLSMSLDTCNTSLKYPTKYIFWSSKWIYSRYVLKRRSLMNTKLHEVTRNQIANN